MVHILWDASALAKHYAPEAGSDTVDEFFTLVEPARMRATAVGYAETVSVLLRKRNRRTFSPAAYGVARTSLQDEVLEDPDFDLLSVDDAAFLAGVELVERHNLNAADAAVLVVYVSYAGEPGAPPCVLIASDERMLRAARLEGLATLDPESVAPDDVPDLLARLAVNL